MRYELFFRLNFIELVFVYSQCKADVKATLIVAATIILMILVFREDKQCLYILRSIITTGELDFRSHSISQITLVAVEMIRVE